MNGNCIDVTIEAAAGMLKNADRILILCHGKPDGDTLGSGLAMLRALLSMGKTARIACSDGFPPRYDFLYGDLELGRPEDFEPDFVLAVDVADVKLMGKALARWRERVDLCIDHHMSNMRYARHLLLDSGAAATTELVYLVLEAMGAVIREDVALCLYTGLVTDTGCFRYSNTTSRTLRIAASLLDTGIDSYKVNKRMFETHSLARLRLEQLVLQTLELHCGGRLAILVISQKALEETGVAEEDTEGISTIPRQIEGVELGLALKEQADGRYRISVRTGFACDASAFCEQFGGGGHARAAGCMLKGSLDEVKATLLEAAFTALA